MDLPKRQICPFVHVLVKEDINDPVEISLPIVYKGLLANKYGNTALTVSQFVTIIGDILHLRSCYV